MKTPSYGSPAISTGPYKFLDYFEEIDQASFAGRDLDIQEVITRIARSRTLILYSRSGLGKTSLLKAGVFPRLRERDYHPIYVRTLKAPLPDLFAAVAAEPGAGAIGSVDELVQALTQLAGAGTAVLVFDQFEEFFIRFRPQPEVRADFLRAITPLVRNAELSLRIVFSLREDRLAELDEFRKSLPDLFGNQYRLLPLTAFGSREATVRPLVHYEIPYAPALVNRLVDLLSKVDFDPPLLQIVCTEVYREAKRRAAGLPYLDEEALRQVGELEGIFQRYLDAVTQTIPQGQLLLTRTLLDALITREDTKQAATLDDLASSQQFVASAAEITALLDHMVASRLVRKEYRDGQEWFELIHERLVGLVKTWLDLDQDFSSFRVARELVANSCRGMLWRRNRNALLSRDQYHGVVHPYRERLRFNPTEIEYLLQSILYNSTEYSGQSGSDNGAAGFAFWAERFGVARSEELVLGLLNDPEERMRLGANRLAGELPDADGRLFLSSLRVALNDPSEPVRRAAGRTLGRLRRGGNRQLLTHLLAALGSRELPGDRPGRLGVLWKMVRDWTPRSWPPRLGALGDAVRDWTSRPERLQVLADLMEEGDRIEEFSILQRFLARRIADRRRLRAHAAEFPRLRLVGAVAGLAGGAIWYFTIGLCFISLAFWLGNAGGLWYKDLLSLVGLMSAFLLPASAILGWLAATSSAQRYVTRGGLRDRPWLRSKPLVSVFAACFGIISLATISTIISEQRSQSGLYIFGLIILSIIIIIIALMFVVFTVTSVSDMIIILSNSTILYRRTFFILLACLSLPYGSVAALLSVLLLATGQWAASTADIAYTFASTISFLTAVVTSAVVAGARWCPIGGAGTSGVRTWGLPRMFVGFVDNLRGINQGSPAGKFLTSVAGTIAPLFRAPALRLALLVIPPALVIWYGCIFGSESVPFLAHTHRFPQRGPLEITQKLGPGQPVTAFVSIASESARIVRWRRDPRNGVSLAFESPANSGALTNLLNWILRRAPGRITPEWKDFASPPVPIASHLSYYQTYLTDSDIIYIPEGTSNFSLYWAPGSRPAGQLQIEDHSILEPISLQGGASVVIKPEQPVLAALVFKKSMAQPAGNQGPAIWEGSIGGKLAPEHAEKNSDTILVHILTYLVDEASAGLSQPPLAVPARADADVMILRAPAPETTDAGSAPRDARRLTLSFARPKVLDPLNRFTLYETLLGVPIDASGGWKLHLTVEFPTPPPEPNPSLLAGLVLLPGGSGVLRSQQAVPPGGGGP